MSASLTTFRRVAVEFASEADADVEAWLAIAASLLSASQWGAAYTLAACYLAAHMWKRTGLDDGSDSAAAGPLTSARTGELAESYASASTTSALDADLATTRYGLAYLRLRSTRVRIAGPRVIRVNGG